MFALLIPPRPPLTPADMQTISPTQVAYTFPSTPGFSSLVVFALPDTSLPPDTLAGIYLQLPGAEGFTLLGALGPGRASAVFRVNAAQTEGSVTVGISIEPAGVLGPVVEKLGEGGLGMGMGTGSGPSTKVLAQRIIKNAFNFLASFESGDGKVSLRSFEDWWRKFERKVELDPSVLEKDDS